MTLRRLGILLAAAALAIAGSVWVSSQRQTSRSELAGKLVLPELKGALNQVSEVRLAKAGDIKTTLRKADTGWVVAEREFPADSARVRKLLLDLSALQVLEEKTSDPQSYSQLGVETLDRPNATSTRVELVMPGKSRALFVGKVSGSKSGFVRVADAKQSLLAAPRPTVDADPKEWLDRSIVNISQARVQEVRLRPAGGPAYTISRKNKDQADFTVSNIPRKRKLSSNDAASPIAGSLEALSLDDVHPVQTSDAKGKKLAQADFKTFDGLSLEVSGRKADEKHFITLKASSSAKDKEDEAKSINARAAGREFEIPSYKYEAIFRPLDELLEKP